MKIHLLFFFGLILSTLIVTTACDSVSTTNPKTPEELKAALINKNWELRSVEENGYGVYAPESDSMYTLNFSAGGGVGGRILCNSCGGNYSISPPNRLFISGYFCTEIACQSPRHPLDFSEAVINQSNPFYFDDNRLFITVGKEGQSTREFRFAPKHATKEVIMARQEDFDRSEWPDGMYQLDEANIAGDSLYIKITYSGCGPHDLNLVFNNYFMESLPVQAYAIITHKNEACRAVFRSEETFDLTPLKKEYRKGYGNGEGTIDISIRQNGETETKLRYEFD
ncbi:META domain-containing protein [Gracilimonas mengyeensis]|uniref:META domain-containing protein n=1 Tax=Gracilimonas mengyeensis TaxID=1302730 RepID=A0A521BK05_9BACT|nr:META domain-containing protein [Gracilimonas mengyeensis]SMO47498.1 META domain-containing protein [Gracilimonas mengyeensis]